MKILNYSSGCVDWEGGRDLRCVSEVLTFVWHWGLGEDHLGWQRKKGFRFKIRIKDTPTIEYKELNGCGIFFFLLGKPEV